MTGDPSSSRHPSRSRECASRSRECGGQPETPGTTEGRRKTRTKEKPIKQASRLGLERQGSKSYSKSYKSKIPQQSRGTQLLREALRRQKKRRVQKATSWTEDAWIQEQLGRKKKSTTRKKDAVAVDVDVNTSTESGIVERDEIEKHVTPGEKECSTLAAVAEEKHTGAAKKVYQSNGNVEQQLAKNIDAREQKEHAEEAYPYDQQQSHNLHQNEIEKIQHKNLQQEDHVSSSNKKEEKSTTTTTKSCKPSLEWRNLTFQVGSGANQDPKTILDRCYGRLHPGELCALIGPSGAGKSTLMNLLAGRQDWGCYDPCDNHVDAYHAEQNDDEPDVDNNVQVVDKGAPSSPTRTHHLVSSSAALRQGTSRPLTSSATATNIKNNTKVYKTSTSSKGTCTMYKTSSKGTMGKNVRQEGVDGYSSSASSAATTTASESESSRASSNLTSCVGSEGLSDVFASSSCTELTTDNEESQEDAYSSVSEIEMEDNAEGTTIRRGRKQDYKNRAGVFKRKTKRCNIDETTCTGATGNSTTTRGTAPASSANISNQSTTNALAQRASTLAPGALRLTGSVRYGSQLLTQETLKQSVSYVMQEDALHPRQTVYEVLLFAARMRLVGQSEERMRERVASLMQLVGLEGCRDVLVGDHLIKGISGGQKKRLSVAIELLTSPEILFLDEPTSGLDSFYSLALIRSLREICRAEQNIMCCTIHQPSAELFSMFDRVYCLRTGRVLLCGALQAGSVIRDLRAFGRLILKNSRGRKGLEAREQEEIEEDADDDADENDAGTDDQDSSPESESEQEKHALLERGSRIIQKTTSKRKSTSGSEKMGSPRTSPRTTTMLTTMKKERKSSVGRSLPSLCTIENLLFHVRQPLRIGDNMADWLLYLAQTLPAEQLEQASQLTRIFYQFDALQKHDQQDGEVEQNKQLFGEQATATTSIRVLPLQSFRVQVYFLWRRENRELCRNKKAQLIRLLIPLLQCSCYGIVFYSAARNLSRGENNRGEPFGTDLAKWVNQMTAVLGAMHHCLFITLAATAAPNMLKIPQERPVFLREYNARTYSVRAYLTAKFLADLPLLFISATSLLLVCYLLYGMQSNFVHHWILNFSIALAGSSLGTLLACLSAGTPGAGLGVILAPLILDSFPECFSSVMQPLGEIPLAFRWLSLFAPHAYAVSIAGDLEFDYIRTSSFPQGDSSPFAARREAYIQETAHRDPFTTLYWKNPLTTKMQMKDDEVETDGFNGYIPRFWFTVVLLVVISALLRVIACWNLARISRSLF